MKFEYPSQLPVSTARDDIAETVRASQVVIISGQTGSGKTTQLPKILLELGRGSHGRQIVHTQPRRLAARTVAERIASEMDVKLGEEVGYQVRFTDESSPKTRLRVVTDGILLAQIQRDPKLMQYDTIVIDEAHERSLNIDFLLGYLTALLPKRRDLKLVITSATIDSVKFQEHFEHALHTKVPVIEVSGRTYPVQIVYEPLGTAPALMRSVPGFETGAMPGDADYESAVRRAGWQGRPRFARYERGHAHRRGARLRRIGHPFNARPWSARHSRVRLRRARHPRIRKRAAPPLRTARGGHAPPRRDRDRAPVRQAVLEGAA